MKEPYLTQFREMIRRGASSQDIHDAKNPVKSISAENAQSNEYIDREVARVEAHQKSLLPLLEHFAAKAPRILDVGCSSGGTSVALALSKNLKATEVIGIDPNKTAVDAARVRALGFDIEPHRLKFLTNSPRQPLPFPDCTFDLITCVSVLEFVTEPSSRQLLASEIQRVAKPGGYIFLATPSPYRLREHHTGRFLGHIRHRDGYPWSSTPQQVRRMFNNCERIQTSAFVVHDTLQRHMPGIPSLSFISPMAEACFPWQKHLFRKSVSIRTD